MVRLVFRPYTQVRRSICTLESLRASTKVSPGFALLRHSSPSFGSPHFRSHSNLDPLGKWSVDIACKSHTWLSCESFTLIVHWEVNSKYSRKCETPWSVLQDGMLTSISCESLALVFLKKFKTSARKPHIS